MEVILERLLVEVLAVAVQLALWRLLELLGFSPSHKPVVASATV